MDIFDPLPVEKLGNPDEWVKNLRGGPPLGTLLAFAPEKAAEVLAQQGIAPPSVDRSAKGGYGAPASPWPADFGPAPTEAPPGAGTQVQKRFPNLPPATDFPPGETPPEPTFVPQQPGYNPARRRQDTGEMQANPPIASNYPTTTPGYDLNPREARSESGGEQTAQTRSSTEPNDLSKTLQGLRAIAPPSISPVSTPSVPTAHVPSGPGLHFAPAPARSAVNIQPLNPLAVLQALAQRGAPGGLNALLRR